MELEKQVVSLELAKRLKELGVKQESYFFWKHLTEAEAGKIDDYVLTHYDAGQPGPIYHTSAFTVAELGEIYGGVDQKLPDGTEILMSAKYEGEWRCGLLSTANEPTLFSANTEAEARGLMLAYLIENNLLDATLIRNKGV